MAYFLASISLVPCSLTIKGMVISSSFAAMMIPLRDRSEIRVFSINEGGGENSLGDNITTHAGKKTRARVSNCEANLHGRGTSHMPPKI